MWPPHQPSALNRHRPFAHREPISGIIGLTALIQGAIGAGITIGGTFISAGAIGGAIVGIAGSIALSAASAAMQRRQTASALPGGYGVSTVDQGTRQAGSSPIPPQRLALGVVTTSFEKCFGRKKPPYIWIEGLLAAHRCGRLRAVIVNGRRVPLESANGGVVLSLEEGATGILRPNTAPFYDGITRFIEVSYRDGRDYQAICPIIARDFTNPAMPATFRQQGHTTVTVKLHYGANDAAHKALYGSDGQLNLLFEFEGAPYIDLRVPGCSIEDPESWVSGSNASLNIARYLYHQWSDARLLDPGQLNWDLLSKAADIDDLWRGVVNDDGTMGVERNHTVDCIVLSPEDPVQKIRELLTACDGELIIDRGKYHVLPGHPYLPIGTLHQDMLAGGFDIQQETPDRDFVDTIMTEFIAPDRDYKPAVGPVLKWPRLATIDGQPLETTLSLIATRGHARAQRLARRKLIESRGGDGTGSERVSFSAVWSRAARRYKAGDVVRLYLRDFPKWNGVYQIKKRARGPDGTIVLDMLSFDKRRFAHHAPTDQQPFTINPAVLAAEAA